MNQPDLFSQQPEAEPQAAPRAVKSSTARSSRRTQFLALGLTLLIVVIGVIVWAASDRTPPPRDTAELPVQPAGKHPVEVEVLNAAGGTRLAQRFTDYLRSQGFDVVDMGNARYRDAERTIVIDRSGNAEGARAVAEALGLTPDRVLQQPDKNLMLDVTVIIGRDYGALNRIPHTSGEHH